MLRKNIKCMDNMNTVFTDWGMVPYDVAWEKQLELFHALIESKSCGTPYENQIIFCEHPHVYTLGKNGKAQNMQLHAPQLEKMPAAFFHVDRGGDITYHGPGQQVCYLILNLDDFRLGIKQYIYILEEAVIRVCARYGIRAERINNAIGIWIDATSDAARKICAIGIHCSHAVTMHGLALNVNTDLRYFNYIHPCGFVDKGVTSLQKELQRPVPMDEAKLALKDELGQVLGLS